jgi:putative flippase GtrA
MSDKPESNNNQSRFAPGSLIHQFIKYAGVGGVAFICDYATFALAIFLDIHYLLSTFLAFCVGVTVSYSMCVFWVWRGTKATSFKDMTLFLLIGVVGLLLTLVLMWFFVELLSFNPLLSKLVVTGLVLIWNFGMRRAFVFFR